MLAALVAMGAMAFILRYMPPWSERLAFLSAICAAAVSIALVLLALESSLGGCIRLAEPTPRGSCRFWLFGTVRLVRNWDRIGTNG